MLPFALRRCCRGLWRRCGRFWDACCAERVFSPVLVMLVHATLVADVASHRPGLRHPEDAWSWGLWLLVASTVALYFGAALADPGWLQPPAASRPPRHWGLCCCCCLVCAAPAAACAGRSRGGAAAAAAAQQAPGAEDAELAAMVPAVGAGEAELAVGVEVGPTTTAGPSNMPKRRTAGSGTASAGLAGFIQDSVVGPEPQLERLEAQHKLRWCRRCSLWQPLRTKHCSDCGRCVRTHDHHCPWIGSCVGENNRVIFFWFLTLQAAELLLFFAEGLRGISVLEPSAFLVVGLLAIMMLFMMVSCLLSFHVFLVLSNLTTWEHISWPRITYLKQNPVERGSPFSHSCKGNITSYCCGPRWCPGPLRRLAMLRYEESGGIVWELTEPRPPSCLLELLGSIC